MPADETFEVASVAIVVCGDTAAIAAGVEAGSVIGRATCLARDLVNCPPDRKTPPLLADQAITLGERMPSISITVFDEDRLVAEGFGGIIAVGKGSDSPPRSIIMEYGAQFTDAPAICVVGKGLTFDSEYLAAIRSDGVHLALSTLVFPDELVDVATVNGYETLDDVAISSKELAMAKSLVEAFSERFDPSHYVDEYRLSVEAIIEKKASGKTPVAAQAPPARATVIDLASALEASLRNAKQARANHSSATSPRRAKAKR